MPAPPDFINLLINAAHAIKKQGVIRLRSGCDENQVWVEVIDDGAGIPPDIMNRTFDPFFTTKPLDKGTTFLAVLPINAQPGNPTAPATKSVPTPPRNT